VLTFVYLNDKKQEWEQKIHELVLKIKWLENECEQAKNTFTIIEEIVK
jgi:hypothetical protein